MSKSVTKWTLVVISVIAVFALMIAASGQKSIPYSQGRSVESYVGTYTNSQIDTVIINRDPGLSALSFGAHFGDSVSTYATAAATVRRVVDGVLTPAIAGDTLTNWSSVLSVVVSNPTSNKFANGTALVGAITLAPLADQYLVILKYAAAGQGTSHNVKYEAIKQFGK